MVVPTATLHLKNRLVQHFVRKDSSVATGASAVTLNPDLVTTVVWWTDDSFNDRVRLEAAELVAFEILNPVLRSRARPRTDALDLFRISDFQKQIQTKLDEPPDGEITIPTLQDALNQIKELEARVEALEGR
jgi:hypothetical protein